MSEKIKEYLWSSTTTFVAAFLFAVAPLIGGAPLDKAALFAILMAGVRAGVKAVLQLFGKTPFGRAFGARF
jgi:hypothetical protein